jgi:hypothetical protein
MSTSATAKALFLPEQPPEHSRRPHLLLGRAREPAFPFRELLRVKT